MKIAYLSTFYPFRGGIAQFNATLLNEFKKEHDATAYTFKRQYPKLLFPGTTQMVESDDPAEKINSIQLLDTINPFSYENTFSNINKSKPNILVTKFWMPFFAPSLGWVCKRFKSNKTINISILDNVIPHERRLGDIALTKFFLNQNHGFIVMSKKVENDLLSLKSNAVYEYQAHPLYEHFGKKIDKQEARKYLSVPDDKKILLFFGFIRSYKGLDLLIDAMKYLGDDYMLIIAGEIYGDFSSYQNQIDALGLNDKIKTFVRYISDDEVQYFFSASDVCMLPYKSATQSGIVGISYQFDLPVIATNTGGLSEMITPFNTGLMVDEPNSKLIANAIINYFNNNMNISLVNNILKYKELASWSNLSKKIITLFDKIKG